MNKIIIFCAVLLLVGCNCKTTRDSEKYERVLMACIDKGVMTAYECRLNAAAVADKTECKESCR